MADEQQDTWANQENTAEIVSAYVSHNQLAADQLPALISAVHEAISRLGAPAAEAAGERTPAVPIRRSVQRDFVVCLDCGWKGKMLKRHLTKAHNLSAEHYRARWNLAGDHALVALAYSERRSTLAKQLGLGQRGRTTEASPPAAQPGPKTRRRPRATAALSETS